MMDHFELGRVAFEARQFIDAETHLSRVHENLPEDKNLIFHKMRFELAKMFRPESSWRDLEKYTRELTKQNQNSEALKILDENFLSIEKNHQTFFFELSAQIFYLNGSIENARKSAIQHINLLIEKKLTHKILAFSEVYNKWFPWSLYFRFTKIQALASMEAVSILNDEIQKLYELVTRKWRKIDDCSNTGQIELINTAGDILKNLDVANGESVLISHYIHLISLKLSNTSLKKEEWKKLIEIIVQQTSWRNLKLCLEIAIANNETEIAIEAYRQIKSKKSYSFVKLTKNDQQLKTWLLENGGAKPYREPVVDKEVKLTFDDLKLDNKHPLRDEKIVDDETEELEDTKQIEVNAIKQLSLHSPGMEIYPDLVITYQTLNFRRVVKWLLENFDYENSKRDLAKKMRYLHVTHLMNSKQNNMALAVLEEMLGDETLSLDEFKELKYVQGNLLLAVGKTKQAYGSFREVQKIDPNYRLLKKRILKIATN